MTTDFAFVNRYYQWATTEHECTQTHKQWDQYKWEWGLMNEGKGEGEGWDKDRWMKVRVGADQWRVELVRAGVMVVAVQTASVVAALVGTAPATWAIMASPLALPPIFILFYFILFYLYFNLASTSRYKQQWSPGISPLLSFVIGSNSKFNILQVTVILRVL